MADDGGEVRLNSVKTLLRQKMDWLDKATKMLIQRNQDPTDAQREYARCVTWLIDLNTSQPTKIPSAADDSSLLNAIHKLEVYVATGSAVNDLIAAVNGLIAAYKAP